MEFYSTINKSHILKFQIKDWTLKILYVENKHQLFSLILNACINGYICLFNLKYLKNSISKKGTINGKGTNDLNGWRIIEHRLHVREKITGREIYLKIHMRG